MLKQEARQQVDLTAIRKENAHPGLEVNARATDPYVAQGTDSDLTSAIDALKAVSGGVGGFMTMQESNKADNATKGAADQLTGKHDKPQGFFNLGVGYDESYYHAEGQARAGKFATEWKAALLANDDFKKAAKPQEAWDKAKADLYAKHFGTVTDNPMIMAAASPIYHSQDAQNKGQFLVKQTERAVEDKLSNYKSIQKDDIRTQILSGTFNALATNRAADADYFQGVEGSVAGTTIDRTAWQTARVDTIGETALELMQNPDPNKSSTQKYQDAVLALSLLKAPGTNRNGATDIAMSDVRNKEGKAIHQPLISHYTSQVAAAYTLAQELDAKRLKETQDDLESKVNTDMVMSGVKPQEFAGYLRNLAFKGVDKATAEKYGVPVGTKLKADQVEKLRSLNLRWHDSEEGIQQDNEVQTTLAMRIETTSSVVALKALQQEVHGEWKLNLKTKDHDEMIRRISSRIDEYKKSGREEKSLRQKELEIAFNNVDKTFETIEKSTYTPTGLKVLANQRAEMKASVFKYFADPSKVDIIGHASGLTKGHIVSTGVSEAELIGKPNPAYGSFTDDALAAEIPKGRLNLKQWETEMDRRDAAKRIKLDKLEADKQKATKAQ